MTTLTELTGRVRAWSQEQADAYRQGEERPLGGYLTFLGIYSGAVAASGAAIRLSRRRIPERVGAGDVALLTVATHRLARTIAKDPITSPIRAPFTEYEGTAAAGELAEGVRGHGVQHSLGELLACPMCLAQWVATAFSVGLVVAPRPTRMAMTTLTAVAGADFLQYFYAWLQQATEK
jgi:hypothetical protein